MKVLFGQSQNGLGSRGRMLSKKYYNKIANLITVSKTKKNLIDNIIEFFAEDNPSFDTYRFKEACCYKNLEGE